MACKVPFAFALASLLCPSGASGQLLKWLARDVSGVRMMDMTTPVPTVGPVIAGLGTSGTEDVNLMTDQGGNVLFYSAVNSSGLIDVFDATLAQMPNGSGLFGHTSSLQSAISPVPCHPDRYYLIHLVTGLVGALYYSVVDMSLNGGSGDVTQANTPIGTGFTEGLAVSHQLPNGCRWLFSSLQSGNSYQLVRCLISQSGIGPPTVIATVGTSQPAYNFNEIELSPDNSRIAMSTWTTAPGDPDITIWDLDVVQGTVTNGTGLQVSSDAIIGVQFSPLGHYVYYVGNSTNSDMDFGRVDVGTGTAQVIDPWMGAYLTMVELAGNGRIYVGMNYASDFMAEVTFPDDPVLANIGYTHNAIFVSTAGCRPALPSAIEGEPPGTTTTPGYIAFSAVQAGGCDTYQFVDSTCLSTWWEWDFGDGTISNDPAPVHTFPAGTFDITVRVVACGDTLQLTIPAYIQSTTVLAEAFMSVPDTLCIGQAAIFGNTSIGATDYSWDLGDGTFSTDSIPVHAYATSGTFNVTLVASNGCSSDTATGEVHVVSQSTASFSASGTCSSTIVFSNTSTGATDGIWTFGDGAISTDWSTSHSYPGAGSYIVQLIVNPNTICADTVSQAIDVAVPPEALFTDSLGCEQDLFLSDGSLAAVSWSWSFGDGGASFLPSPEHTYGSIGIYVVTLVVTSAEGCTDTTSVEVDVTRLSAAFATEVDTCTGTVVFHNLSINATGYAWDLGDGTIDQQPSPTHVYAASGPYNVELIVVNGQGCTDTTTMVINAPGSDLEARIFVPNCFTPNNDGINDRFEMGGSPECLEGRLSIFNRWGAILLDAAQQLWWDGKMNGEAVPDGVYLYVLDFKDQTLRGHVTLLR